MALETAQYAWLIYMVLLTVTGHFYVLESHAQERFYFTLSHEGGMSSFEISVKPCIIITHVIHQHPIILIRNW